MSVVFSRRRTSRFFVLALLLLLLFSSFAYHRLVSLTPLISLQPIDYATEHAEEPHVLVLDHPTFADVRQYERTLPQHTVPLVAKPVRARYVYFPWEAWGTGWNNVFQEQLLNTHLAYLAHRGYVFVDYIARDHPPFPDTLPNGTRHMLHIPMNALTSGPTGGGSFGAHADPAAPRAASREWWDAVCPPADVVELQVHDTNAALNVTDDSPGEERLMKWAEKLRGMEEDCVMVLGGTPFDYKFFGTDKLISMWPSYGHSPTLTEYAWSALVTRAISRNFHLLSPPPSSSSLSSSSSPPLPAALKPTLTRLLPHPNTPNTPAAPLPLSAFAPLRAAAPPFAGLLGLHVRRGDYAEHCAKLVGWETDYNAWNLLGRPDFHNASSNHSANNTSAHGTANADADGPNARATGDDDAYPQLPDHLSVPPGTNRSAAAFAHCWPSADAIVQRARAVRAELAGSASTGKSKSKNGGAADADKSENGGTDKTAISLHTIYIATNGAPAWVRFLAARLQADGWARVASSLDLALGRDERAVGNAVDMGVLVGAEAFVGVGFSSLSSNVVQLRLAGGRHPRTNRFW